MTRTAISCDFRMPLVWPWRKRGRSEKDSLKLAGKYQRRFPHSMRRLCDLRAGHGGSHSRESCGIDLYLDLISAITDAALKVEMG